MFARANHMLRGVPVGRMTLDDASFCISTIETLSKQTPYNLKNVKIAERLLVRLVQETDMNVVHVPPKSYVHVIRAWGNLEVEEGAEHAMKWLEILRRQYEKNPLKFMSPINRHVYSALLHTLDNSRHPNSRLWADKLVRDLETHCLNQDPPMFLPDWLYNRLISIHANKAEFEYGAAAAADDWVTHLAELAMSHPESAPKLTTDTFNRVLRAWVSSPEDGSMDRSLTILNLMMKHSQLNPTPYSFGTIIAAYAKRQNPEQAEKVFRMAIDFFNSQKDSENDETDETELDFEEEEVEKRPFLWENRVETQDFDDMFPEQYDVLDQSVEDGKFDLTRCFNAVLFSHINSEEPVEKVAESIKSLFDSIPTFKSDKIELVPDATSYESLIHCLIMTGNLEAADEALEGYIESFKKNRTKVPPPKASLFQKIRSAWSKTKGNADRLDKWLREAMDLHDNYGMKTCGPTDGDFFFIIKAWCEERGFDNAMQMIDLAESRDKTNVYMYNCLINAMTEDIQERYSKNETNKEQVSMVAYNNVRLLQRLERQIFLRKESFNPMYQGLYTRVLAALAKVGTEHAAETGKALVMGIGVRPGTLGLKPSTRLYTSAINAYSRITAKAPQLAREAVAIFGKMVDDDADPSSPVTMDETCFFMILQTISVTRDAEMAQTGKFILSSMASLYVKNGRAALRPTTRCYDAAISGFLKCNDARAAAILLKNICDGEGFPEVDGLEFFPSEQVFQEVCKACAKADSDDLSKLEEYLKDISKKMHGQDES